MERFERICFIDGMLWSHDCPVLLEKGALLIDTKKNINVLQLKFRNLQEPPISAVYLIIKQKDVMGNVLGDIERFYLDLSVKSNEYFGNSVPIELTFKQARSFDYIVSTIVFADGTKWQSSECLMPIATPNKLTDLNDLKDQFKIEVHKLNYSDVCENLPYQGDGYWICACGHFNLNKSNRCLHCNLDKNKLFEISNSDFLSKEKIILEQDKHPSETISEMANAAETSNEESLQKVTPNNNKYKIIIIGISIAIFFIVVTMWNTMKNSEKDSLSKTNISQSDSSSEMINNAMNTNSDKEVINIFESINFNMKPQDISNLLGDNYEFSSRSTEDQSFHRYMEFQSEYTLDNIPGKIVFLFDETTLQEMYWIHYFDNDNRDTFNDTVDYISTFLGEPTFPNTKDQTDVNYWDSYKYKLTYSTATDGLFFYKIK